MICLRCAYANNNGPPVRMVCICCCEPLVGKGVSLQSVLGIRAKFARGCYDPMKEGRRHAQKTAEFETSS